MDPLREFDYHLREFDSHGSPPAESASTMNEPSDIDVNVHERILRPVEEVFQALVDPDRLSRFFVTHASAPLVGGTEVEWEFADVGARVRVSVFEVEPNELVIFDWGASRVRTRVTIRFRSDQPGSTVVSITESRFPLHREGVLRALGQNAGWTYFLCCLKAWVQHGVNLRKGVLGSLIESDTESGVRSGLGSGSHAASSA
jgi:uncharacterized protein YndB with AHSA1/START domain